MKGEQDQVCRDFRLAGQVSAEKGESSSLFRAAIWGLHFFLHIRTALIRVSNGNYHKGLS